jgi:hypothetical protein
MIRAHPLFVSSGVQAERDQFSYRFRSLASSAVPLATIREADALRTHVVAPLLADLPAPERGTVGSEEARLPVGREVAPSGRRARTRRGTGTTPLRGRLGRHRLR